MRRGGATSLVAFATLMRNGRARKRPAQVHKRRAGPRRTELDHVGAYNFMVEIEGIGSSGWDFGTPQGPTGQECTGTYEDVEVFEYDEEAALRLRDGLVQPQARAGVGLDSAGGSCALGNPAMISNPYFVSNDMTGEMTA
mmetsp:Transcript_49762/g.117260  ORF Transcript_49762/g.117260 Transcript_49762/m.117260 type:complete len:140 (-) Transcript_49762:107-526(-)